MENTTTAATKPVYGSWVCGLWGRILGGKIRNVCWPHKLEIGVEQGPGRARSRSSCRGLEGATVVQVGLSEEWGRKGEESWGRGKVARQNTETPSQI